MSSCIGCGGGKPGWPCTCPEPCENCETLEEKLAKIHQTWKELVAAGEEFVRRQNEANQKHLELLDRLLKESL